MPFFKRPIDYLIDAVTSAASPESRKAAADALAAAIADAANRGEDLMSPITNPTNRLTVFKVGPAELAVIGNMQRTLADIASGSVEMTQQSIANISAQLGALLSGTGMGLPGLPGLPPTQIPGFPIAIPQIPGLDPCKFIKCLAASMDCNCGSDHQPVPGGTQLPPIGGGGGNANPIGTMVNNGIEILNRARDMTDSTLRTWDQRAKDLAAAAKSATGKAKAEIDAAKKEAEAKANELREKSEQLGRTIGSAIVNAWPPK